MEMPIRLIDSRLLFLFLVRRPSKDARTRCYGGKTGRVWRDRRFRWRGRHLGPAHAQRQWSKTRDWGKADWEEEKPRETGTGQDTVQAVLNLQFARRARACSLYFSIDVRSVLSISNCSFKSRCITFLFSPSSFQTVTSGNRFCGQWYVTKILRVFWLFSSKLLEIQPRTLMLRIGKPWLCATCRRGIL